MAIVNTHYGFCARGGALNFTYTGEYNVRDDGVVELLTSGTLVFLSPAVIDRFMVGGGGSGAGHQGSSKNGQGGGGGGYTRTDKRLQVSQGLSIAVIIGVGGSQSQDYGMDGGSTSWNSDTVKGGLGGGKNSSGKKVTTLRGGAGGSGGGGQCASSEDLSLGYGGSDGNNGGNGTNGTGGEGQGTTTREFGEDTGKLYAGGGSGGRYVATATAVTSIPGDGGGGTGAWVGPPGRQKLPTSGVANTGGGGGGGCITGGASGGSGIVCFRAAK